MFGYKFRGLADVNRRRDRRIVVSLPTTVNQKPVLLKDISLGGLAFISEMKRFKVGADVLVEIQLPDEGCIKVGACVVRKRGKSEYGAAFTGLSVQAFRLIEDIETGHHRRLATAQA
jgi:c-di-GMP-binding flagellar brake protein YcgR